jgi:hypothetical protein
LPFNSSTFAKGKAMPAQYFAQNKTKILANETVVTNVTFSGGAYVVTADNSLEIGDLVSISGVLGCTEINTQLQILTASGTQFTAAAPGAGLSAVYVSGGYVAHIGWCTPPVSTTGLQLDFTLQSDVQGQTPASASRFVYEDSPDGVNFNTLAIRSSVSPLFAPPGAPQSQTFNSRSLRAILPQDLSDCALGESAQIRLKVFIVDTWGATPGAGLSFSASLRT